MSLEEPTTSAARIAASRRSPPVRPLMSRWFHCQRLHKQTDLQTAKGRAPSRCLRGSTEFVGQAVTFRLEVGRRSTLGRAALDEGIELLADARVHGRLAIFGNRLLVYGIGLLT